MKFHSASCALYRWFAAFSCLVALGCCSAIAADMNIEVQLLWGTDDATSPNPEHKPVSAEVRRKLSHLPLKWSHYFEVTRTNLLVTEGKVASGNLSKNCRIEVKILDPDHIEIGTIGQGKPVLKSIQRLPKDASLVIGGDAPNSTSWLIFLKRGQ